MNDADRNRAYVRLLDDEGRELARLDRPVTMDALVAAMDAAMLELRGGRERLARYCDTFGRADAVERWIAELGSREPGRAVLAHELLLESGATAYLALRDHESDDPEVRRRIGEIRHALAPLHEAVLRRGLHRDVDFLWEHGARGRLARILPPPAPLEDPRAWWARHRARYRWDARGDRYVESGGHAPQDTPPAPPIRR